ncbi:hypothetical protein [Chroococcidiopsis sp.]|uniref:hypothetical protein n=1 Tax=Chroococcidiopsis sp. TaxID=3088168 RepID=UPI003F2DD6A0
MIEDDGTVTIRYGDQIIDNKSNQISIGYWKDGLVVRESYNLWASLAGFVYRLWR